MPCDTKDGLIQAYLGPGVGFVVSTLYGSYVGNWFYTRVSASQFLFSSHDAEASLVQLIKKNGGVAKPEMRIPPLIIASFIVPIGLL